VGIDLSVIIGHGLDAEAVFELPARLSASLPVRAAASSLENLTETWQWSEPRFILDPPIVSASAIRDQWALGHDVHLEGPGGFHGWYVGPGVVYGRHLHKYGRFLREPYGLQTPVRRFCRALAAALGSDRAIYLPDSCYRISAAMDLVDRGDSFAEVVAWLRAIQPPSPTIDAIDQGDGADIDGYFIDDFADLDRVERHPVRQRAWSAGEIADLASILPRYLRETPNDGLDRGEGRLVHELATWLASVGRYERAELAGLLNKHGLSPVPERLRPLFACLELPEDQRVASVRATYSDPVPPLVELLDAIAWPETLEPLSDVHAAAVRALAELGTDDAVRALIRLSRRLAGGREVVDDALRRCGARLVGPLIDGWDQLAFGERYRLLGALRRSHVRDPRLRATLVESLAKAEPYNDILAIGAYGDDGLIPDLHRFIDGGLASHTVGGSLYLARAAGTAVRTLGGALTEAQTRRLTEIIEELEPSDDPADRDLRNTAVSMLQGS
jgi:hypothetical protein